MSRGKGRRDTDSPKDAGALPRQAASEAVGAAVALLAARTAAGVRHVALRAEAMVPEEPLRAPASGLPCVYWRLRVFELIAPGVEFVHEAASDAPVELRMAPADPRDGDDGRNRAHVDRGGTDTRPVRLQMDRVRVEAQPTLHRPGSPGAERVARRLGLPGAVRVEEVLIKPGEALEAEGLLLDPSAEGTTKDTTKDRSLFRASGAPAELVEATIRLPSTVSLRPALLPWALGTAAAVLGAAGIVTTLAKVSHLWRGGIDLRVPAPVPEIGSVGWKKPKWP